MMAAYSTIDNIELRGLVKGILPAEDIIDTYISTLEIDSRKVEPGSLFFGLNGSVTDGREYVNDAIRNGAAAIILEGNIYKFDFIKGIPVYEVSDIREIIGRVAARFYGHPSAKFNLTGVTGTNGKTSIVYFLNQALIQLTNKPVGTIGTLGSGSGNKYQPSVNTTPDILTLNHIFSDFCNQGIERVVMEVSSHGLDQGRVNSIEFDTAVFTNLSQDHLDYHRDMGAYGNAKRKLFFLPSLKNAVININDEFGASIASELAGKLNLIRYKLIEAESEYMPNDVELAAIISNRDIHSVTMNIFSAWGEGQLTVNLVGDHNATNILACIGVLCVMGFTLSDVLSVLSNIKAVPGRMELLCVPTSPKIFIDYSHTPDALEKALQTLSKLSSGKLVCVFGCGGNRDREKRPLMGNIAENYCDAIVLTNDNPRNEPAGQIISDIQAGMSGRVPCHVELDRAVAIRTAIDDYSAEDFILVAGKGHEAYQEIEGKKLPFSDRQLVINLLESLW